ncbi:MAG TPA: SLBB domain-containing protein, partial [Candidatus Udaeobacter sp.]|nr:SLBB domain-containing protein [Candidatus Udaeobacter sp.]
MRLFDGPDLHAGAESFAAHLARLGPAPAPGKGFLETLARAGMTGRGGASFPVAVKWTAVARNSHGRAIVLVNGAEGEPQSKKDRALMATRPHLILDGAFIAARVVHASRIVLYIGETHSAARHAMQRALLERPAHEQKTVSFASAPARYVAGQEGAAIHLVNEGIATPTSTPPFPFERGIDGSATLVQNVETLAHVALIARTGRPAGTSLVTLAGAISSPGVLEVDAGTSIGEVVARAGGPSEHPRAVLLGGYFGSWLDPGAAWNLPVDAVRLKELGLGLGCGVIGLLPASRCPVCE